MLPVSPDHAARLFSWYSDVDLMITRGHQLEPLAAEQDRIEGGARGTHTVVGVAVGALDVVGAVLRVWVQSVVLVRAELAPSCWT